MLHWLRSHHVPFPRICLMVMLGTLAMVLGIWIHPAPATQLPASSSAHPPAVAQSTLTPDLEQQSRALYNEGRYTEAIALFEQLLQRYEAEDAVLQQAMTLSNLALAHQRLGDWEAANGAIAQSVDLLNGAALAEHPQQRFVLAQTLDIQGQIQLEQGQAEAALATWQAAAELYEQLNRPLDLAQNQINQGQAMQTMGLYRRAVEILLEAEQHFQAEPDSVAHAVGLRSLGDALRVAGSLDRSQQALEESLAIAERVQSASAISAAYLSLGNTLRARGERDAALNAYRQAASDAANPLRQVQANLNAFSLLSQEPDWAQLQTLQQQIQQQIDQLPSGRSAVYARVNYASSLMTLGQTLWQPNAPSTRLPNPLQVAEQLTIAIQQAQALGDRHSESYAVGTLGTLYEQTEQWAGARQLTEQALMLAQSVNADDISYRWQWQLGRILAIQSESPSVTGDSPEGLYRNAIAAYSEAVTTLQRIRKDLVAINPEVQFSFQESVEPIHRELVSLLLKPGKETPPENLETARQVLESLQVAELENFFQEACLEAQPVAIDEVDQQAAVVYSILLSDRLEVILSLPQQPLTHYSTLISEEEMQENIVAFRQLITNRRIPIQRTLPAAQQFYDWLIRPAEAELENQGIQTLVFVLDGALRNVPMATLHDGEKFLVERFGVALTPGLQLLTPRRLENQQINVLAAGLTDARQGFSPLPNVTDELFQIQAEVSAQVLLNEEFTFETFQEMVRSQPFPVVHLATHGKFSSNLEDTFILTWDDRLDINELSGLLQNSDLSRQEPIELLVLSACQTASGDRRATLGLAGMAVRAGARSTMASLWSVDDRATSELMIQFYEQLNQPGMTKAEALRLAQVSILQNPQYNRNPYFWAPFVLVGNWL